MMSQEKKSKKIITGKVVLNFPYLFKVNPNSKTGDTGSSKYGTTIIISKDDNYTLNQIYSAIDDIIKENNIADKSTFKLPVKDGDADHPYERIYENSLYLYASSSFKPQVVDHKVKKIEYRIDEFPNGTYAKICMELKLYEYCNKKGISAELINVQILQGNKLLELRSKPEDDFVVEEVDKEE